MPDISGSNLNNLTAGLFTAFAYESITISTTVKSLTSGKYTADNGEVATRAIITVENARLRYRYDGDNPTSSEGHILNPNNVLVIIGSANIQNFRAIRVDGTDAVIRVTYEA